MRWLMPRSGRVGVASFSTTADRGVFVEQAIAHRRQAVW